MCEKLGFPVGDLATSAAAHAKDEGRFPIEAAHDLTTAGWQIHDVAVDVQLKWVTADDEARLLQWRNEPATRRASFNTAKISAAAHADWFRQALADPNCLIFIVEVDGRPVGQVRLTRRSSDEAEIHIGLTRRAHGRGTGRRALCSGVSEGRKQLGVRTVLARVREDNEASLRAFAAAGFREVDRAGGVVELCVSR